MSKTQYAILALIQELLAIYPTLRVCQLLSNVVPYEEKARRHGDLYYITDEDLLRYLQEFKATTIQ